MQISHEEAHRLIQFHADGSLKIEERHVLASHLEQCGDCQKYVHRIEHMESVLRPMLRRNWDRQHLPLSISKLIANDKSRASERLVVATRIVALAVMFMAFFLGAWNFRITSRRTPTPFLGSLPVIPTPFLSTRTAGTETSFENCTLTTYTVEKNDTLASIAYHFSIPEGDILKLNSLQNETVITGQALSIPRCNPTPTDLGASHTTTFTPVLYSTTTTPGG